MTQPLLQPALLVSENCPECRGTADRAGVPCADCDGSGRHVREVPMSEAYAMMQREHEQVIAPPPSMLREQALNES